MRFIGSLENRHGMEEHFENRHGSQHFRLIEMVRFQPTLLQSPVEPSVCPAHPKVFSYAAQWLALVSSLEEMMNW